MFIRLCLLAFWSLSPNRRGGSAKSGKIEIIFSYVLSFSIPLFFFFLIFVAPVRDGGFGKNQKKKKKKKLKKGYI